MYVSAQCVVKNNNVIPAKAGIHGKCCYFLMDSRFRGNDSTLFYPRVGEDIYVLSLL